MERSTSQEHIAAVLAIEDRVLRNFWVTQTYADLSSALTAVLDPATVNWCTFGTWASSTVGGNLRGEALPAWLHRRVVLDDGMMGAIAETNQRSSHHELGHVLGEFGPTHIETVVEDLFGACAMALSEGNTEVFAEIAPVAAVFLETHGAGGPDPAAARRAVLAAAANAKTYDDRNRLEAGFTHWCDAVAETDPSRRSQLILAGSLELGDHEQHHLQGPIEASMAMGIDEVGRRLRSAVAKDSKLLAGVEDKVAETLQPLTRAVADLWLSAMTELLGHLDSPDGSAPLNRDVPPLPNTAFTPPELSSVLVDDLGALLRKFNRADADGQGSAAINWADLGDRMNFITNLFLSRHHHLALLAPPFDDATLLALEADQLPDTVLRSSGVSTPREHLPRSPQVAPSVGLAAYTPEGVAELRTFGDAPADAAVAEFFRVSGAEHLELFRKIGQSTAVAVSDEELPGVAPFLAEVDRWPDWVDPKLIAVGERVFGEWGCQLGMGLWLASLPADYVLARGAIPLAKTTRLTKAPRRRYLETAQLYIDAMTPGGLQPGAPGYITVRHVRLMHAAVRHALLNAAELDATSGATLGTWDSSLGVPINQQELLGCMFSISIVGLQVLDRSGVHLSHREREGYVHAWNLAGHLLGIRSDLLPLDLHDATAVWQEICRQEMAASVEGAELTAAAISCIQEMFPYPRLNGLPASAIRHFLGDEVAGLLSVPPADWTRHLFTAVEAFDEFWRSTIGRLPGVPALSAILGRRMLQSFVQMERMGNRPGFEISSELCDAWGIRALSS